MNFQREILANSVAKLHLAMRFFFPFSKFNERFSNKKKKNISNSVKIKVTSENNLCLSEQVSRLGPLGPLLISHFLCIIYRIAGWDVKKYPRLYDKFHIGDQVLSVNDVQVSDLAFAQKIVKHIKAEFVELTIRRLPNASVFAIQRSVEGENLGIKREGGTAEVHYTNINNMSVWLSVLCNFNAFYIPHL